MGDENNDGRPRPEWERQFERHRTDAFAHQPMVNRLMQENVTLRERLENRVSGLEKAMPDNAKERLSVLERFKAQSTILGAIGFMVLGAVTAAAAARLIGLLH